MVSPVQSSKPPALNLLELWWAGVVHPHRAFEEVKGKPAPMWGFRMVLLFNLAISLTSLLALYLLGRQPFLPSWLTFLPTERYYGFEIFFLPVVRIAAWLLGSAVIHLGVRLGGKESDIDQVLNIGGLVYLVLMPYTFLVDWTAIALDAYGLGLIAILHGTVDLVWSLALYTVGLRRLLKLRVGAALVLALLGTAAQLPLLIIFAR